ncbi:DUF1801 domain-containing protein [Polyangium spumosum]|uniref:DUF1801 domain-containing protein n=1 Tax=Polyangium spumosum TaxID=889282 RepID=A0A6N7QBV2_9BACT|nr:DUF1801 domain-containing protein [Polyangium spumosum]
MASKNPTRTPQRSAPAEGGVEAFLATLDHPFKREIVELRGAILGADACIGEGIKWNAPSFRTSSEYFATFHLRAKEGVQIILHLGAKKRDTAGVSIADPEGLLEWLGKDRASVRFRDAKDVKAKRAAFVDVVRQWIEYV